MPFARAGALGAIAWASKAAFAIIATAIIFRTQGPAEYGLWALVAALRSLILVIDVGLALPATRDAAQLSSHAGADARLAGTVRLYLTLAVAALAIGIAASPIPAELLGLTGAAASIARTVTILFALEAALTMVGSPFLAVMRGLGRLDVLAATTVVASVIGIALTLVLVGPFGLIGASVAALASRVVLTALQYLSVRRIIEFSLRRTDVLGSLRGSLPLWAIIVAGQIGTVLDTPFVAFVFGAEMAGLYAAGASVPSVAAGLLFAMMDSLLGRHASASAIRQERIVAIWCEVGSLLAAVGFGTIIAVAPDILNTWIGSSTSVSADVLRLYAIAWAMNIPAHALILALISRERHSHLVPVLLVEAAGNVVLSLALLYLIGPTGPAWATVAIFAASHLLVVPLVYSRILHVDVNSIWRASTKGYLVGGTIAIAIAVLTLSVGSGSLSRVVVALVLAVGLGGAAALRLLRGASLAPIGTPSQRGPDAGRPEFDG
jgi:O-antigen/teichoic acid export membrane protein